MRKDKARAFELRREGKSYAAIQSELGVSRSTLSNWFQLVSWSRHVKKVNTRRVGSKDHIQAMMAGRKKKLESYYSQLEVEAIEEYKKYRGEPLFWAGLMIYAGEGDKKAKHKVSITSSEFYLHKIFIKFAEKYLEKPKEDIKVGLLIYPDHNESLCREMWSNLLGIKRENFYKTFVIQGKDRLKQLQYGVGMSIIPSTALKKKVLKWLDLAHEEKFAPDAVIV